jgi:hypothetical protein
MKFIIEKPLSDFEWWSGAVTTATTLDNLERLDGRRVWEELEWTFDSEYPDGMDGGLVNDIFWFETDYVAQILGFESWEELENHVDGNDEEDEEEEEAEEEEKEKDFFFKFDPCDSAAQRELMDKYGKENAYFVGENINDERITFVISPDKIENTTFQANGGVRQNVYWRDGTVEELYCGKWTD